MKIAAPFAPGRSSSRITPCRRLTICPVMAHPSPFPSGLDDGTFSLKRRPTSCFGTAGPRIDPAHGEIRRIEGHRHPDPFLGRFAQGAKRIVEAILEHVPELVLLQMYPDDVEAVGKVFLERDVLLRERRFEFPANASPLLDKRNGERPAQRRAVVAQERVETADRMLQLDGPFGELERPESPASFRDAADHRGSSASF